MAGSRETVQAREATPPSPFLCPPRPSRTCSAGSAWPDLRDHRRADPAPDAAGAAQARRPVATRTGPVRALRRQPGHRPGGPADAGIERTGRDPGRRARRCVRHRALQRPGWRGPGRPAHAFGDQRGRRDRGPDDPGSRHRSSRLCPGHRGRPGRPGAHLRTVGGGAQGRRLLHGPVTGVSHPGGAGGAQPGRGHADRVLPRAPAHVTAAGREAAPEMGNLGTREHEQFIEAVRRRDPDAASTIMREHLERTAHRPGR